MARTAGIVIPPAINGGSPRAVDAVGWIILLQSSESVTRPTDQTDQTDVMLLIGVRLCRLVLSVSCFHTAVVKYNNILTQKEELYMPRSGISPTHYESSSIPTHNTNAHREGKRAVSGAVRAVCLLLFESCI